MKIHALNSLEFKVSVVRPSSARSIEIVETTTAVTVERLFVLCILFGRAGERASGFRRDYKFVHIGLGFLFFFFFFSPQIFSSFGGCPVFEWPMFKLIHAAHCPMSNGMILQYCTYVGCIFSFDRIDCCEKRGEVCDGRQIRLFVESRRQSYPIFNPSTFCIYGR